MKRESSVNLIPMPMIDKKIFISQGKGKIMNNYEWTEKLGAGAFGEVWKAKYKPTGDLRAIKKIAISGQNAESMANIIQEVDILKDMDHPNIVRIFEHYKDSKYFYVVTEYLNGGELF